MGTVPYSPISINYFLSNPSFRSYSDKSKKWVVRASNYKRQHTVLVSVKKRLTNINSGADISKTIPHQLINKGSKHSIYECRAYLKQTFRRTLKRNHNICLRSCETLDHFA
jgi:hypothetical protein